MEDWHTTFSPRGRNRYWCNQTKRLLKKGQLEGHRRALHFKSKQAHLEELARQEKEERARRARKTRSEAKTPRPSRQVPVRPHGNPIEEALFDEIFSGF